MTEIEKSIWKMRGLVSLFNTVSKECCFLSVFEGGCSHPDTEKRKCCISNCPILMEE